MTSGLPHKEPHFSDEVFIARYFKALDRFDIRFATTMWVYDNVRAGAEVLHIGCGAGKLGLLKRKDVTLTGVDTSEEFAQMARRNGYDAAFQADPASLPFADATFDYVVSFGALNFLSELEEASLLVEMKRVLRPGGVNLHSIECNETVTGADQTTRFLKVFKHVATEPYPAFCLSAEDVLNADEEQPTRVEEDFLEYVRGLSFKERRAFDLAMGYVFSKLSDVKVSLPGGTPQILLKASDAQPGPFYGEHRDRRGLFSFNGTGKTRNGLCLDRSSQARFDEGWFAPTLLPPVARWMGKQGRIRFQADSVSNITLDLTTQLSDLQQKPLELEISLNGAKLCAFTLYKNGWLPLSISVPEPLGSQSNAFELELRADRTAQLRDDDREVSVAVCNIEVRGGGRRPEVGGQKSEAEI